MKIVKIIFLIIIMIISIASTSGLIGVLTNQFSKRETQEFVSIGVISNILLFIISIVGITSTVINLKEK